jgi:hypothetical protein
VFNIDGVAIILPSVPQAAPTAGFAIVVQVFKAKSYILNCPAVGAAV